MGAENDLQSGHLDRLFEHRNKEYGAYALRKGYNGALLKGSVGMCLVIVLCMGGLLIPFTVSDTSPEAAEELEEVVFSSTICEGIADNFYLPEPQPPQEIGTDAASFTDSVEPEIFTTGCMEISPQYPGGREAMLRFIDSALGFPGLVAEMDSVMEKMERVTVMAHFKIDVDGQLTDIRFPQPAIEPYQTDVRRLLEAMPKWIPGTQNGKPVPMYKGLPIIFLIAEE